MEGILAGLSQEAWKCIALSYRKQFRPEQVDDALKVFEDAWSISRRDGRSLSNNTTRALDLMLHWLDASRCDVNSVVSVPSVRDLPIIRDKARCAIHAAFDPKEKLLAIGLFLHASYHHAVLSAALVIAAKTTTATVASSSSSCYSSTRTTMMALESCWTEGKDRAMRMLERTVREFDALICASEQTLGDGKGNGNMDGDGENRSLLVQFARLHRSLLVMSPPNFIINYEMNSELARILRAAEMVSPSECFLGAPTGPTGVKGEQSTFSWRSAYGYGDFRLTKIIFLCVGTCLFLLMFRYFLAVQGTSEKPITRSRIKRHN